jgi:hypothetical protein
MQVVLTVLFRRGLYIPFIVARLSALLDNNTTTGLFLVMLKSQKSANFTSAQTFQIDGPVQLAVEFPRTDIASMCHFVQLADLINLLQIHVKMQCINEQL